MAKPGKTQKQKFVNPLNRQIGRRTGKNARAQKTIRVKNGFENFDDYLSESDADLTRELHQLKNITEEESCIGTSQDESKENKISKANPASSILSVSHSMLSQNSQTNPLHRSKFGWMKNRNIGRRTGKDLRANKQIRVDANGIENFDDYLSETDVSSIFSQSSHFSSPNSVPRRRISGAKFQDEDKETPTANRDEENKLEITNENGAESDGNSQETVKDAMSLKNEKKVEETADDENEETNEDTGELTEPEDGHKEASVQDAESAQDDDDGDAITHDNDDENIAQGDDDYDDNDGSALDDDDDDDDNGTQDDDHEAITQDAKDDQQAVVDDNIDATQRDESVSTADIETEEDNDVDQENIEAHQTDEEHSQTVDENKDQENVEAHQTDEEQSETEDENEDQENMEEHQNDEEQSETEDEEVEDNGVEEKSEPENANTMLRADVHEGELSPVVIDCEAVEESTVKVTADSKQESRLDAAQTAIDVAGSKSGSITKLDIKTQPTATINFNRTKKRLSYSALELSEEGKKSRKSRVEHANLELQDNDIKSAVQHATEVKKPKLSVGDTSVKGVAMIDYDETASNASGSSFVCLASRTKLSVHPDSEEEEEDICIVEETKTKQPAPVSRKKVKKSTVDDDADLSVHSNRSVLQKGRKRPKSEMKSKQTHASAKARRKTIHSHISITKPSYTRGRAKKGLDTEKSQDQNICDSDKHDKGNVDNSPILDVYDIDLESDDGNALPLEESIKVQSVVKNNKNKARKHSSNTASNKDRHTTESSCSRKQTGRISERNNKKEAINSIEDNDDSEFKSKKTNTKTKQNKSKRTEIDDNEEIDDQNSVLHADRRQHKSNSKHMANHSRIKKLSSGNKASSLAERAQMSNKRTTRSKVKKNSTKSITSHTSSSEEDHKLSTNKTKQGKTRTNLSLGKSTNKLDNVSNHKVSSNEENTNFDTGTQLSKDKQAVNKGRNRAKRKSSSEDNQSENEERKNRHKRKSSSEGNQSENEGRKNRTKQKSSSEDNQSENEGRKTRTKRKSSSEDNQSENEGLDRSKAKKKNMSKDSECKVISGRNSKKTSRQLINSDEDISERKDKNSRRLSSTDEDSVLSDDLENNNTANQCYTPQPDTVYTGPTAFGSGVSFRVSRRSELQENVASGYVDRAVTVQMEASTGLTPCLSRPGKSRKSKGRRVTICPDQNTQHDFNQEEQQDTPRIKSFRHSRGMSATPLPSLSSTPVHLFETTTNTSPANESLDLDNICLTDKIILPEPAPEGLRRSQRRRFKRIEWGKEWPIWDYTNKDGPVIVGVKPSKGVLIEEKKKRKRKLINQIRRATRAEQRDRRPARRLSVHTEIPDDMQEEDDNNIPIINIYTQQVDTIECVCKGSGVVPVGPHHGSPRRDDPYTIRQAISQPLMSQGVLSIKPKAVKPTQLVSQHAVSFHVTYGKLIAKIHETKVLVETGDTFFVPIGNTYSLTNLRADTASLFFTIHREMEQSRDESGVQQDKTV